MTSTDLATVSAPMSRRASRRVRAHYVVAADESSLPELEASLATLPLCATGRVFVEVPDASWIAPIEVPARMTLTWLDRSRRSGQPGTGRGCSRGQALARAVTAWADEMLCEQTVTGDTGRAVLLGDYLGTADIVDHLTQVCGMPRERIVTPAVYGLPTAR